MIHLNISIFIPKKGTHKYIGEKLEAIRKAKRISLSQEIDNHKESNEKLDEK